MIILLLCTCILQIEADPGTELKLQNEQDTSKLLVEKLISDSFPNILCRIPFCRSGYKLTKEEMAEKLHEDGTEMISPPVHFLNLRLPQTM